MNETKQEEIRKEAKKILDSFAVSLEKISIKEKKLKRKEGGFRKEGDGISIYPYFREQMFKNAPASDDDCIIAEKKKW